MFIFANIGLNGGLHIIFLLYGTQPPVIGGVGKELGTLIRLLDILRHALKTAELVLLLKKKD